MLVDEEGIGQAFGPANTDCASVIMAITMRKLCKVVSAMLRYCRIDQA